ncbi:hypothetical protein C6500_19355 [Candidatus Poribacteria bacterium]|nr:MAG: hypothetical protein C6500_19355 [Candidatus Poribacteria bacterium]
MKILLAKLVEKQDLPKNLDKPSETLQTIKSSIELIHIQISMIQCSLQQRRRRIEGLHLKVLTSVVLPQGKIKNGRL